MRAPEWYIPIARDQLVGQEGSVKTCFADLSTRRIRETAEVRDQIILRIITVHASSVTERQAAGEGSSVAVGNSYKEDKSRAGRE